MSKLILLLCPLFFINGCASRASKIEPSYISSAPYETLSCSSLAGEGILLSTSAAKATGRQNKAATEDAIKTGVGLVIFWPILFFNEGNGIKAAEVARLKGEMAALQRAAKLKKCDFSFREY